MPDTVLDPCPTHNLDWMESPEMTWWLAAVWPQATLESGDLAKLPPALRASRVFIREYRINE